MTLLAGGTPPVAGAARRGLLVPLGVALVATAMLLGALGAVSPGASLGVVATGALVVVVWRHPFVAAVLIAFVTPLVTGIDRGRVFPLLRPNEALVLLLAVVLLTRHVLTLPPGPRPRPRLNAVEWALLGMAAANSVFCLALMGLRERTITPDDISYALVLWKFLALYAVVRTSVKTDRHIRVCLLAALSAAAVVAAVGILQALDLLGMRQLLADLYAPFGYTDTLAVPRGSSTVGLPAAVADLLVLNLVAAVGLWWKDGRHPVLLTLVIGACTIGTFAAGEFSSTLGLTVAVVCTAVVAGRPGVLRFVPLGAVVAVVVMWPVVEERLAGFQSTSGWPVSWTVRLYNLNTYFVPDLFSGTNPLFGVRPSARVAAEYHGFGYVWIESGYLWLLWGGGIPLLVAFAAFVVVTLRTLRPLIDAFDSYASVAALAAYAGTASLVVLMVFDPHLTYRGSADWLFSLLAMASVATRARAAPTAPAAPASAPAPPRQGTGPMSPAPATVSERPLLRVHAWLVALLTILTVGAAAAVALSRPVTATSEARVEILPTNTRGAPLLPDMGTERQVAASVGIAEDAATQLGTTATEASEGLSVTVVTDARVLVFRYSAPTPRDAANGVLAFTNAYVDAENSGQEERTARVISPPRPVPDTSRTTLLVIMAVGLLVGLGLGAGAAWLWDRAAGRVRSTAELARSGLPVRATGLPLPRRGVPRPLRQGRVAFGMLASRLVAGGDRREAHLLRPGLRILVTAPRPRSGTSAVAINLADALVALGADVVVVDANTGAEGVSSLVGGSLAPGFPEVLAGKCAVRDAVRVVTPHGPRLLPSGSTSAPQGVDAKRLEPVLGELSRRSIVVVDGPPVLEHPTSRLLADRVDVVLLVTDLHRLARRDVALTVESLDGVAAALVGWLTHDQRLAPGRQGVRHLPTARRIPTTQVNGTAVPLGTPTVR